MPQTGQGRTQFVQHGQSVVVAAAIGHAIDGNQYRGLNLPETVEHGVRAHVGRADAPHTADADRGQKRHHGLGHIGQVGGHAVARLHALGLQVQCQRCDLAAQFGPGHLAVRALFVAADDGRHTRGVRRIHMAQHLARIVDLGTGKPLRSGHGVARQHRAVRRGRLDVKVVPHALPEGIEVGDGPAPEGVVVVEGQATLLVQPVLKETDLGKIGRLHTVGRVARTRPGRHRVCTVVQTI